MAPNKVLPIDGLEPAEMKMMGCNLIPLMSKMFRMMPTKMRKNMLSKQNAPQPGSQPKDLHDVAGESPYTTEEIVPGNLWSVKYTFEDKTITGDRKYKDMMKMFGMDFLGAEQKTLAGAKSLGPEFEELCKKDLEVLKAYERKELLTDDDVKKNMNMYIYMFVVKLNSGSLLLYCPLKIREEHGFKAWLDGLGKVEYIVVGASSHTNYLAGVFEQYPEAKIIGPPAASDKIKVINGFPRNLDKFDVNSLDKDELAAVNDELEKEGVKLFSVEGDVATNALAAVTNNILLNCDLVYGSHDGVSAFGLTKEQLLEDNEELATTRLFRCLLMSKPNSPNGTLAKYRFYMMDPKSMGAMNYDLPAADGSTGKLMAESLRGLLQLEFRSTLCVHNGKSDRESFRKDIDANWSWLDGNSLL